MTILDKENNKKNILVDIKDEMQESYMQYAMSTIISRALPNAYDGCKPVQRRIFHVMNENKYYHNTPYRKSARIVGDVIGKYHPHGEVAVYESMARLAQTFTVNALLIDGQGNFGSMDGDPPAAMRYTETRLTQLALKGLLADIEKDTVNFQDNYDNSQKEPVVLPAAFPHLLVNGCAGVAVGMATNIPPHNLGEAIDVCIAYIRTNGKITINEIMAIMPGPDFPTGGAIIGRNGINLAYNTGKGIIIIRSKTHIEELARGKKNIIITEVPYQTNKAKLIENIIELVNNKKIEGISDVRDETDRTGLRVVIELKKDVAENVILNQLFDYSNMQISFGINIIALHENKPILMSIKKAIEIFVQCRIEVVKKRTVCLLNKTRSKCHTLVGLCVAVINIEKIIALIKSAKNTEDAINKLTSENWEAEKIIPLLKILKEDYNLSENIYKFTENQTKAILEMRLNRLVNLEYDKLIVEINELSDAIKQYEELLSDENNIKNLIISELTEIKNKFSTPRKTSIEEFEYNVDIESLIEQEDIIITITIDGYIKRVPLSFYKSQNRGGKGRSGHSMKSGDEICKIFYADTHTSILFFSNTGKVYRTKAYKLPSGDLASRGRAIINMLPLDENEKITTTLILPEDGMNKNIVFVTENGKIRRNKIDLFDYIPTNGKTAIKLEDDKLIDVVMCDDSAQIFIATSNGRCIRFEIDSIRTMQSRTSSGVTAISRNEKDKVVSVAIFETDNIDKETREEYLKIPVEERIWIAQDPSHINTIKINNYTNIDEKIIENMAIKEQFILTITDKGFGKCSSIYEYRITNRGGVGIANISLQEKTGNVIASLPVKNTDEIMLITDAGTLIRMNVQNIRITSRNTKGVILIKTDKNEKVVSVTPIYES